MYIASHASPVPGTQTLERPVALLRAIAAAGEEGATLDELCAESGASPSTTYRLLQALCEQGLVRLDGEHGRHVLSCAQAGNPGGLRDQAHPALLRLAECFGDSFFLLVPDGDVVLCLERQGGKEPVRSYSEAVGGCIPMGVGQGSQVLLAHLGRRDCRDILRHNAATLRLDYGLDAEVIAATLPSVRRLGYACGLPDRRLPGYTGLAVPIVDAAGQVLGALSCALSRLRMTAARRQALAEAMMGEVTRILGSPPGATGGQYV